MTGRAFSLEPFTKDGIAADIGITGNIARHSNTVCINYLLSGRIEKLAIPAPADIPARKNVLWENTCFEFFIAMKGSEEYLEFNLSPAGDWNVYRFESYRRGMVEESGFDSLPFLVLQQPESVSLDLTVDLENIIPRDRTLEIAVTAVIKSTGGASSYWALAHGGANPDFHRRDGFIIELG
jgi:hypothetical protein